MTQTLHIKKIGSGYPLILLHGWGWNSRIWEPLIPQLAESYQLFLVDLPGFGKSPIAEYPYTIENVALHLLEAGPDQATWLGWSLGGMIAWWIAAHYPRRITNLITIGASPKFLADTDWPGISPQVLDRFTLSLQNDANKTLLDFLELQLRGGQHQNALFNQLKPIFNNISASPGLLGGLKILQTLNLRPLLSKVTCPSLHVFGSHDTLVPKETATQLQPLIPNASIETIHRANHMPFLTHTGTVLNLIRKLLVTNKPN